MLRGIGVDSDMVEGRDEDEHQWSPAYIFFSFLLLFDYTNHVQIKRLCIWPPLPPLL